MHYKYKLLKRENGELVGYVNTETKPVYDKEIKNLLNFRLWMQAHTWTRKHERIVFDAETKASIESFLKNDLFGPGYTYESALRTTGIECHCFNVVITSNGPVASFKSEIL